jgi:hypothetical protein
MATIYWGETPLRDDPAEVAGGFVERDGELYYRIGNYDRMPPFLMTLVSAYDHWLFVSSSGGLTCGRREPGNALFPYVTDDKIHDAGATTGPLTMLLVDKGERRYLWEPFSRGPSAYGIERNLYKNRGGNRLLFEEINHDLELVFQYEWSTGDCFGFIRTATLSNPGSGEVGIEFLDGLRNLLPHGVDLGNQTAMSTLVDAYKQAETVAGADAAIYSLSSILTDRAEPSEALLANVAWCVGIQDPRILLSEDQLRDFAAGRTPAPEPSSKGRRGAFLVSGSLKLAASGSSRWYQLADVAQGPSQMAGLLAAIRQGVGPEQIEADIRAGTDMLLRRVGSADGCQHSSDQLVGWRHFSNTLFNIMRGGTFHDGYRVPRTDFLDFVSVRNEALRPRLEALLKEADNGLLLPDLLSAAENSEDPDMIRLAQEYLPLVFSRRHGDPSRPWNAFCIDLRDPHGSERLRYEGNWRDIFQNWEALALSYPECIESVVAKFVNASTADGYNPFRIARDGIDWEVLDPAHPWSNIGYWGDHQVNYLVNLLQLSLQYHPSRLADWLGREWFVFADVPYRLKPYRKLVDDPRNSIEYDRARAAAIEARVAEIGSEGKLAVDAQGNIHRATLIEKFLVAALAKLTNFVPGGGIWMNTQRPEWNDANNALAGYGLSMVTLFYLRRFLAVLARILRQDGRDAYRVSAEVLKWFMRVREILEEHRPESGKPPGDESRQAFMDELGPVGEDYREQVYDGFSGRKSLATRADLIAFTELALEHLDHTISLGRREDGLYHAYNLVRFGDAGYSVEHLYEMLEGQVAALSSGCLGAEESLDLLDALRSSPMYLEHRSSYLLYPDRELPPFLDKNVIPQDVVDQSPWIQNELLSGLEDYIEKDTEGRVHFNARFRNARELRAAMERDPEISAEDVNLLCGIYESVFDHHRFTGQGLGLHDPPDHYGAFPTDPYSHTPAFAGAQQPGMTGQVKEDIIARFGELGVRVEEGMIGFEPLLLGRDDFISGPADWAYSTGGEACVGKLAAGSLAFTLCGVPVIYRVADEPAIRLSTRDEGEQTLTGSRLDARWSRSLFRRDGQVLRITVDLPRSGFG